MSEQRHDPFNRFSDDDLVRMEVETLRKAHRAPKDEVGAQSDAYARWSREWMDIRAEIKRRGIVDAFAL